MYGTTHVGGQHAYLVSSGFYTYGFGTVFRMTQEGAFTSLHSFGGALQSGCQLSQDGSMPVGNLVRSPDGSLVGTTFDNGPLDCIGNGTIFRITTNGLLNNLYAFGSQGYYFNESNYYVWPEGRFPGAGLTLGSDGNFYGTTTDSGTNGWGTIFRITPSGIMNTLHSFDPPVNSGVNSDGFLCYSELVEGKDGAFYGTTIQGGDYGWGTAFRVTPAGAFSTLCSFDATNGCQPYGGLLLAKDGNFYGTADFGGTGNAGTIFQLTTNGALTTIYSFTGLGDGAYPVGGLIQGSDGNFYGTTSSGGKVTDFPSYGMGTVFRMTPDGTVTTLYAFSGADGHNPRGALVEGKNGDLFGTTSYGGFGYDGYNYLSGYGTIFRLPIPPTMQSIKATNGLVVLTWSIVPGQNYQLQSTTNLDSANWINLGSAVTATNALASATETAASGQHFYRVKLLP